MDLYAVRNQLLSGKRIYDIPFRVAYYARVSTEKDAQLHSLAAQKSYFENLIASTPAWTLAGSYIDEGKSGTKVERRDQFLSMIDDAQKGQIDLIVTKEISRFSRSTLDSIRYSQYLLQHGVGVLFQNDNICTLDSDSELRLTIMSSIAQDEVRKLSERCKFGFKRSIERGVVLGNNAIWGYQKDHGRLVVVPQEASMIQTIFHWYVFENMGMRRIADQLTADGYQNRSGLAFSASTVRGILQNPKYKGYYCGGKSHKLDFRRNDRSYVPAQNWVLYEDHASVPPIVSEEIWLLAQQKMEKRRGKALAPAGGQTTLYRYSGKIECGAHHVSYQHKLYRYKSGDKEAWQCREYATKGKKGCDFPVLYTAELDQIASALYQVALPSPEEIAKKMCGIYTGETAKNAPHKKQDTFICQIKLLNKKKETLLDLATEGRVTHAEFEERNNRLNRQITALKEKINEIKKEKVSLKDNTALYTATLAALTENAGKDSQVIDTLFKKITVLPPSTKEHLFLRLELPAFFEPWATLKSHKLSFVFYRGKAGRSADTYPLLCDITLLISS